MWRDTGNSRYLADALGWNALPLTDRGLADFELSRQLRHTASRLDCSGGNVKHKPKVSPAYRKVNEAFGASVIRGAYRASMLKDTLKQIRKAKGLTQKQLAEKIGVTAPSVTQWEAGGGIDLPNLRKLAKALGTPLKDLAAALERDQASQISDSAHDNLPDGNVSKGNNGAVPSTKEEGNHMAGDGGTLRDEVIRDLMHRLERVEDRLFRHEEEPAKADPRKRRKV